MTTEEAQECAVELTTAFANTAGRQQVVNAYAKQLAPFNYDDTIKAIRELIRFHEGAFCPGVKDVLDGCARYFVMHFWGEVRKLALTVYATRYLIGDGEHQAAFVAWYRHKIAEPGRTRVDEAMRLGKTPRQFLLSVHTPLPPREGGPIAPQSKAPEASVTATTTEKPRFLPPQRTPEQIAVAANELVQQLASERKVV